MWNSAPLYCRKEYKRIRGRLSLTLTLTLTLTLQKDQREIIEMMVILSTLGQESITTHIHTYSIFSNIDPDSLDFRSRVHHYTYTHVFYF